MPKPAKPGSECIFCSRSRPAHFRETVAKFNATTQARDPATSGHLAAIAKLVGIVKDEYRISDADIYERDKTSYKQPGKGAGLFDCGDDGGRPEPKNVSARRGARPPTFGSECDFCASDRSAHFRSIAQDVVATGSPILRN